MTTVCWARKVWTLIWIINLRHPLVSLAAHQNLRPFLPNSAASQLPSSFVSSKRQTHAPPREVARLLEREGIYSSTLADFRKQKSRGVLTRNQEKGSSPKASGSETLRQLAAAEREIRRLRRELEKTHVLLDLQKKVSELMGISLDARE